ncbi:hypothetical protein KR018_003859 [Drosophila ironensis]|nr:hypothetical protein KR018_003859 [Drosophila ironensis]
MFKSKSFDLVSEEKTKKPERLYQPRRMRWLKYIILPAVFAFVLLLILCNVDFSDNSDDEGHDGDIDGTTLYVANYEFENYTLESDFLSGSVRLEKLTIENCTLNSIANGAFRQNSTRNMLGLQLLNVELKSLSRSALKGLERLKSFTLVNGFHPFKALGFLLPVSRTLINATIHQQDRTVAYSVGDFFGSVNYTSLNMLDLSGTNLGGMVNGNSFKNLVALKHLILRDCGLTQIDSLTSHLKSLQYVDLSGNILKDTGFKAKSMIWEYDADIGMKRSIETDPITDLGMRSLKRVLRNYGPAVVGTTQSTTPTMDTTTDPSVARCEQELCEEFIYTDHEGEPQIKAIPFDAIIQITDSKPDEVEVNIFKLDASDWSLIYFDNNSSGGYIEGTDFAGSDNNFTGNIANLNCETPFTLCLLLTGTVTSPLNCRSHKITMGCEANPVSWLHDNIGTVIGLSVLAVLMCCFLGMLIMYGTLRQRPTLLRGSKRLIRSNQDSKSMFLIPGKAAEEPSCCPGSPVSIVDSNDYIAAYHRYLEQANIRQTESNRYTRPPRERAPSVPPSVDTPPALPPRITYEYESLELYEELH